MIKTAIENKQNLIIEGCYIPFYWKKDFTNDYLKEIRYFCLIMSSNYIQKNFLNILKYANEIENRIEETEWTKESFLKENAHYYEMCQKYHLNYILIDEDYFFEITL